MSFVERLIVLCPYLGESTVRGRFHCILCLHVHVCTNMCA